MALSYIKYTGNGSQTDYTFPFGYIDSSDISVTVNRASVPFTFINSSAIRCTAAPAAASEIRVARTTQKVSAPVNFTDGSVLLEKDLDTLVAYTLYIAQEQEDITLEAIGTYGTLSEIAFDTESGLNNAVIQATNATEAALIANAAKDAAVAALDSFDDRYLGAKSVAPAVDNDGAPLIVGAIYFDTALGGVWRAWGGSSWVTAPVASAASVINSPTGSISATNVQAAINELASEKAASGANSDITSLAGIASINGGQLAGMRNRIINGKMDISQRGTSFPAWGSGSYSLDRYLWQNTSASVITISQQADAPADNEFQNSLRVAVTTADTSIAVGDIGVLSQRIEGYNVRDLIGRTFTLSFRVRSSKTGTHCVALKNESLNRAYVLEYTVNAANTWETKAVTVSGGLITAGAWNWANGTGLIVAWSLAAGSNFQTTAGAWQAGDFYTTANQVNCLDAAGNIFAITGVQLEVGPVATPFEHRPIGIELALCQRYYEVIGATPSQFSAPYTHYPYKQLKRATPIIALISGGTLGANFSAGVVPQVSMRCPDSVVGTGAIDAAFSASAEL